MSALGLRAQTEPGRRSEVALVHLNRRTGGLSDHAAEDLPALLRSGDLLVVNDAATAPASLAGRLRDSVVELRLAGITGRDDTWRAVLFGAGDWRTRTEDRPAPPEVREGEQLVLGPLRARVLVAEGRLLTVRFDRRGAALWSALYAHGRPIQYSHQARDLDLWDFQTSYAGPPWAVEMPSAGRPLSGEVRARLRARGVGLVHLTHAAGLSSTGDADLDARLPLPERYDVPEATLRAARDASRVVAVGTSVVRALESAARGPRAGVTELRIDRHFEPRLVDGLLSGIHVPGESHFDLLRAFAPAAALERALDHAAERGYRAHEFGDACLVL